MRDNELIQLFLPIITNGLSVRGLSDVEVVQAFQPEQQGMQSGRTVYFYKLFNHRYGVFSTESSWDGAQEIQTTLQPCETTFKITTYAIQDPTDVNSLTASDLANIVADILNEQATVETLAAQEVGIYRIADVGNGYFIDDKNRHEAAPSFNFTLTHKYTSTTVINPVSGLVPGIYRE